MGILLPAPLRAVMGTTAGSVWGKHFPKALCSVRYGSFIFYTMSRVTSTLGEKPHELLSLPLVVFSDVNVVLAKQALLGILVLSVCLEDMSVVTAVGDTGAGVRSV